MYTTNTELAELYAEWLSTGTIPTRLVDIIEKMITGVFTSYPPFDWREMRQVVWEKVLRCYTRIDPSCGSIFSYLTTIIRTAKLEQRRQQVRERKRLRFVSPEKLDLLLIV
jgi:hypothetical protein